MIWWLLSLLVPCSISLHELVMVGQSVMWATVIVFLLGIPPHLCGNMLGVEK